MAEYSKDAVTGQSIGCRPRQEDAVLAHFCERDDLGLAVLSDGMGGHDDGDLASRILAGEMFGELFLSTARSQLVTSNAGEIFGAALNSANRRLYRHIEAGHISADTGGTLVAVMMRRNELRWLSVGDSPLYLLRGETLRRLNEDHSMAPQIDLMVANGELDPDEGANHAERNCLTSAVTGQPIPRVDCPAEALRLESGDVVVVASDGLETLAHSEIRDLLVSHRKCDSRAIVRALLEAVGAKAEPDQDNTSVAVIKVADDSGAASGVIHRLGSEFGGLITGSRARFAGFAAAFFATGVQRSRS